MTDHDLREGHGGSSLTAAEQLIVVAALVAAVLLVIAVALVSRLAGIPFEVFSRDVVSLTGVRSYTGALSNVGAALWVAAGSVALLSGVVLHRWRQPRRSHLLLSLGCLTMVLAFDDLLVLHESAAPFVGVPQRVLVSSYVVVLAWLMFRHREVIRTTPMRLLGLSCALFAASLALDQFSAVDRYVFEDGFKLVGIVGWLLYLTLTSLRWLKHPAIG